MYYFMHDPHQLIPALSDYKCLANFLLGKRLLISQDVKPNLPRKMSCLLVQADCGDLCVR